VTVTSFCSRISNEILSSSKNVENIEATKIIKNLSKLIEKVDISEFEKPPRKEGGFLSKIFNRGKNFLEKYENMNKEIEVITQELLNYKASLEKDQNDLCKLYEVVSKHSVEINDYILATELAEEEVKRKLDDITDTVNVDENDKPYGEWKNRDESIRECFLDDVRIQYVEGEYFYKSNNNFIEAFKILNIKPTNDKQKIKKAASAKRSSFFCLAREESKMRKGSAKLRISIATIASP